MKRFKIRLLKFIAVFMALNILLEIAIPTVALALTSGPKSPEFMSFTPVATTNMVDLVTGDFNYNLPVLEVPGTEGGGYALSLAYNSGINSEQEASWVGLGWNINPGVLDRNMRGFPDDYSGEQIKIYNKNRPNWSMTTANSIGVEAFTVEASVDKSLRFNNHSGFYSSTGLSFGVCGIGLDINFDANGRTYSPNINPYKMVSGPFKIMAGIQMIKAMKEPAILYGPLCGLKISQLKAANNLRKADKIDEITKKGGKYGLFTFSEASTHANNFKKYTGFNINFNFGVNINPSPLPVGAQVGKRANFNAQAGQFMTVGKAFGYFNDPKGYPEAIMDYSVEKASDYNKRDVFIGMPFSNCDIFGVTGEGLSGGFRGYKDKVENYTPAAPGGNQSNIQIMNMGADISVGLNFGIGITVGNGYQRTTQNGWGNYSGLTNNIYYRFNNDLGGKITYGTHNNDLEKAELSFNNDLPGFKSVRLNDYRFAGGTMNANEAGTSSYITSHTYSQIENSGANSFTKKVNFTTNDKSTIPIGENSIMEYSIYNGNGQNFVYGVPVFTRNETSLSFDIDLKNPKHRQINHYKAFRNIPLSVNSGKKYDITTAQLNRYDNKTILGEIRNNPYVSSYLISQITQPNYVDVNDNGPDEADFGGWTKFNYRKAYGVFADGSEKWYRYRAPYNGLHYSQNSISDTKDDIGSVTTGEKEIYYLERVETKTHIAFFVTNKFKNTDAKYNVGDGSAASRMDGMGAKHLSESGDDLADLTDVAANSKENDLEYLEKIVLFSKSRPDKPIKTVHFKYDYSLVPNVPNNANSSYSYLDETKVAQQNTGKLTLKKVWFEYEGTSPAKISPYEFGYVYKKSNEVNAGKKFFNEYDVLTSEPMGKQNPQYAPEQLDPWANIMPFGKERQKFDIPWRYQGSNPEFMNYLPNSWRKDTNNDEPFDPAAWHLKYIKLPSGGEIHIQYEEKDYNYVQDQPVVAMASLIANSNSYTSPWFDINVDDLGCDPDKPGELNMLITKINDFFGITNEDFSEEPGTYADKVYFKFLYDLIVSDPKREPDLLNPNAEYITGYAAFTKAVIAPGNPKAIRIYLKSEPSEDGERTFTPRQAAYDFLVNQRQGLLQDDRKKGAINYNSLFEKDITNLFNNTDVKGVNNLVFDIIKAFVFESPLAFSNYKKDDVCKAMSNALSFLKLPMLKAKKGGGVRVKRILMYDAGLETGDAQVLGQQFHYILDDGVTSSGVATNETPASREENPLIKYMIRKKQSNFSRLTSGEDKEQTEGPLGESLLPMAAVYHSRIVVENIHSDKTKSGFAIHEFYTTKDYPFDGYYGCRTYKNEAGGKNIVCPDITGPGVQYTNLSEETKDDYLPAIPMVFFSYGVNKVWMAQGFRFIQNSMNGLSKQVSIYGGKYNPLPELNTKDSDNGYLVSMQQNEYYQPGEKVILLKPKEGGGYLEYLDTPGKETEIAIEGKMLTDDSYTLDIPFDFTIGIYGVVPAPFYSMIPSVGINKDLIATHATTKVIRYPAILKSETTYQDGMFNRTEFLAFDANNGNPLIVKSYDGYSNLGLNNPETKVGEVYQFSMPANWKYPEMGPKSKMASNTNQLSEQTLSLNTYGVAPSSSWFEGTSTPIKNVLGVSINTYKKDWESSWTDPKVKTDFSITDDVKTKLNGIWRSKSGYIYKTDENITPSDMLSYQKGYFTIPKLFDWSLSTSQANWMKVSEIKKYSPDGNPLEEVDVMNIPSAVIYGSQYGNNVPVMVAQNAEYNDIFFNDFEGAVGSLIMAHSGEQSMLYTNNSKIVSGLYVTKHLKRKGGLLKLWMAFDKPSEIPSELIVSLGSDPLPLKKIVTTGQWSLYECKIDAAKLPSVNEKIELFIDGYTGKAFVDDVRFQPSDAQSSCFVYDKQLYKLIAQFDDQHFGLYYQYNDEGVLTHKIVETERGLKTVQETQYNIPKTER